MADCKAGLTTADHGNVELLWRGVTVLLGAGLG
jgi:hypothetical protein